MTVELLAVEFPENIYIEQDREFEAITKRRRKSAICHLTGHVESTVLF